MGDRAKKAARDYSAQPSHPRTSPWYSPSVESRTRKPRQFTLSDEADEAITRLAHLDGVARSVVVESAVLAIAKAKLGE